MVSFLKTILTLCVILILASCQSAWSQSFPSAEIVFQGDNEKYEIGFVNADGSNPTRIKMGNQILGFVFGNYLAKPKWAMNENKIYALRQASFDFNIGYASFWKQGDKLKECRNWEPIIQMEVIDSETVLINNSDRRVLVVDLEFCTEIEEILDLSSTELMEIEGVSYSQDHTTLLFGEVDHKNKSYLIVSLDISTQQAIALARGINPSWSPDGSEIAYVQADGIYVMKKDGNQKNKVVEHEFFDAQNTWTTDEIPQPRWSPDGKWLVYHRCPETSCEITESTIYKVEISTGKEQKIIEGGTYPDWKK